MPSGRHARSNAGGKGARCRSEGIVAVGTVGINQPRRNRASREATYKGGPTHCRASIAQWGKFVCAGCALVLLLLHFAKAKQPRFFSPGAGGRRVFSVVFNKFNSESVIDSAKQFTVNFTDTRTPSSDELTKIDTVYIHI
jgi:hypothetical protein